MRLLILNLQHFIGNFLLKRYVNCDFNFTINAPGPQFTNVIQNLPCLFSFIVFFALDSLIKNVFNLTKQYLLKAHKSAQEPSIKFGCMTKLCPMDICLPQLHRGKNTKSIEWSFQEFLFKGKINPIWDWQLFFSKKIKFYFKWIVARHYL